MPTTRSTKRPSEAFEQLEAPTRPRKAQKSRRGAVSPGLKDHAVSTAYPSALLPPVPAAQETAQAPAGPSFRDAATQTDEVRVLTKEQLDAAIEKAVAEQSTSTKRGRDTDEEPAEPTAKRTQLMPGPRTSVNWMFPAAPSTAPARANRSSTPGRIVRGPISRNTPASVAARRRKTPNLRSARDLTPLRPATRTPSFDLKPLTVNKERVQLSTSQPQDAEEKSTQSMEQVSPTPGSQPLRRGLFGSLRGLAQTGIDFAMNLSPRRRPSLSASTFTPLEEDDRPARLTSVNKDADAQSHEHSAEGEEVAESEHTSPSRPFGFDTYEQYLHTPTALTRPGATRASENDRFHYIKEGSEEEAKMQRGEYVAPPVMPEMMSEFEYQKLRHPHISESNIKRFLDGRPRKLAAMGLTPKSEPPKRVRAPLFGPDSHYQRGTVDPQPRILAKYPNILGPNFNNKRSFDDYAAPSPTPSKQAYVEDDHEVITITDDGSSPDVVETDTPETPAAKRQMTSDVPATPRSALRKSGTAYGTIGRRSVNFKDNPVSSSRDLRAHYGPAGQYKGSTFADVASPPNQDHSLSSLDFDDVLSPNTLNNTAQNRTSRLDTLAQLQQNLGANIPDIDFTTRDPNDPDWRPSLSNPRPGAFRVPFTDEDSDEEVEETPAQPSTPRMSHAELPSANTPNASGGQLFNQSFNDSSMQFESTEVALEKARSKAQKYKPKDSSRLSEVSKPVSRSPSPDSDQDGTSTAPVADVTETTAPAVQRLDPDTMLSWSQRKAYIPPALNNTVQGPDGMTDYGREHQHDEWAAKLDWPSPQIYEDAGTGTREIHELIRKNWTTEDDRRGEEFWQKEFDDIERLQRRATQDGQTLQLITGMEGFNDNIIEVA